MRPCLLQDVPSFGAHLGRESGVSCTVVVLLRSVMIPLRPVRPREISDISAPGVRYAVGRAGMLSPGSAQYATVLVRFDRSPGYRALQQSHVARDCAKGNGEAEFARITDGFGRRVPFLLYSSGLAWAQSPRSQLRGSLGCVGAA